MLIVAQVWCTPGEAESGAGEIGENESGGCMEGQRHGWTDGWVSSPHLPPS